MVTRWWLVRLAPAPALPAVLVAVFAAGLALAWLATGQLRREDRRRRLEQIERFRPVQRDQRPGSATLELRPTRGPLARSLLRTANLIIQSRGREKRMASLLEQAGLALTPAEWVVVRTLATLAGLVGFGYFLGPAGGVLGSIAGWAALGGYRRQRRGRRVRAFAEQLPDALQLVVGSLRSGFSLPQAIGAVVKDGAPGLLTREFARAVAETRLGADLGQALERVARRVDSDDLCWAVMAIQVQRDSGGNLAELLETATATIRERDRIRRQVRTLSAEGRLSAYILVGLPIVVALWMLLVRRDYLAVLWTTTAGLAMSIGSIGLVAIGAFWMSRWIRVEV
jgi:tight adherence protein B